MKYQHVILGGSGHVGSSLATALIDKGCSVLVIGHDRNKKQEWENKGAHYEAVDVLNSKELHDRFVLGQKLFILNPPAPPSTDTVAVESKQVQSIIDALEDVPLKRIVAASTYGAQVGKDIGDLGVLYELEQALALKQTPLAIIRSAYYMSNWATVMGSVRDDGILPTMYPADFRLPMVDPKDIGEFAATLMLNDGLGVYPIEGPDRYSPNDVAGAFSTALNKPVRVLSIPENDWLKSLKGSGFSEKAAGYMINMTRSVLKDGWEVSDPEHGKTSLNRYITSLVHAAKS